MNHYARAKQANRNRQQFWSGLEKQAEAERKTKTAAARELLPSFLGSTSYARFLAGMMGRGHAKTEVEKRVRAMARFEPTKFLGLVEKCNAEEEEAE